MPDGEYIRALAVDPTMPNTLYAGTGNGVFKSVDGGSNWTCLNAGMPDRLEVDALAIDPDTSTKLYAGTYGAGVFSIQQLAACVGDCDGSGTVTINEILTMVNIALGSADVLTCLAGDANHDNEITINEILGAVNAALNGCSS